MLADFWDKLGDEVLRAVPILVGLLAVWLDFRRRANEKAKADEEAIKDQNEKIEKVENNVNGKVQQLIDRTERLAKREGVEEGKQAAQVEADTIRHAVKDAVRDVIAPPPPEAP